MPNFVTSNERLYVVFDIDGVLADFAYSFSRLAQTMYNIPLTETAEQSSFRWLREQGVSKAEQDRVWDKVEVSHDFWLRMPSLLSEFDLNAMWQLADTGVRFIYLTNRHEKGTARIQTQEWLWRHALPPGALVFVEEKDLYLQTLLNDDREANILGVLEDSPYNLERYAGGLAARYNRPVVYVFDRRYNQEAAPSLPRVHCVLEFCSVLLDYLATVPEQDDDPLGGRYWQE